jgi:3-hydroxyacyl-CoA dehydrogenase
MSGKTSTEMIAFSGASGGDAECHPFPLLQEMVDAGRLGKKSGRGFYVYEK